MPIFANVKTHRYPVSLIHPFYFCSQALYCLLILLILGRETQSDKSSDWLSAGWPHPLELLKRKEDFLMVGSPRFWAEASPDHASSLTLPEIKSIQSSPRSLAFLILHVHQPQLPLVCLGHSNLEAPKSCITGYEVISGRC